LRPKWPATAVTCRKEEAGWTIGAAVRRLVQQNEQQVHAFTRDELVEMLDQAMGTGGN